MPMDWGDHDRPQQFTVRPHQSEKGAEPSAGQVVPEADGTDRTKMMRFNLGKRKLSLVPASFGHYTAAVLEYGAIKYSANNWRKGGNWSEVYESLQRHVDAFREGEDCDPESGLPHLCHAAFNLMVLIEFFDKGLGNDDRFRYEHQSSGSRLTGRVLEFREPPRQQSAA